MDPKPPSLPGQPTPSGEEVLSQSDVERLLAQVAEEESTTVVVKQDGAREKQNLANIQPYDFRQPALMAATELRKLRLRHEDFIRSLSARLSIYLRLEFNLQMSGLQTISYQKFIEGLGSPAHLTLFKVEPLRGICVLEISSRLGLTIVDRLLGGPGHSVNAGRDLSEIEIALLDQAVQIILNEWCNQWVAMKDLRPVLLGHESNGRFLQTAPHDNAMLVLAMEARVGDCLERASIGFPYYTLEPLIQQLCQDQEEPAKANAPATPAKVKWNQNFNDVPVPVTAEWPGLELTARELAGLKPGDVLQLDPRHTAHVQVRLARMAKFTGRLGTRGNKWAVQLDQVISSQPERR